MRIDWKLEKTAPAFAEIKAAEQNIRSKTVTETMLLFAGLHLVSLLLSTLCRNAAWQTAAALTDGEISPHAEKMLLLLCTFPVILCYPLYAKYIEHRSPRTMGFLRRGAAWKYALGAIAGTAMMGLSLLIACACGAAEYQGFAPENAVSVLLMMPCWMLQGMSEEVEFRGYLMLTLGLHKFPAFAVIISAVMFSCAHLGNPGISLLPLVNLTLAGIMFALIFLRTGSIWCGAALHGFWNFAQGNLLGIKVSGGDSGASILYFSPAAGSSGLLSGGAFGIEGSIGTFTVFLLAVMLIYFLPQSGAQKENLP